MAAHLQCSMIASMRWNVGDTAGVRKAELELGIDCMMGSGEHGRLFSRWSRWSRWRWYCSVRTVQVSVGFSRLLRK